MLKLLRKKGVAKKVIWLVAIVIIISFGFLGTAYLLTPEDTKASYAGKIFGKKISFRDYDTAYNHSRIQAILRHGAEYQKIRQYLDLDAEAWNRLILKHEVKRRKIQATDQDVIGSIERTPFFQRNGQFDTLLYNAILRELRMKPRNFEEHIRDNIKFQKLFNIETKNYYVDEIEVLEAYKLKNEKTQISYALITADQFTDQVSYDTSALEEYFTGNKLDFLVPPTVHAQYITLDFPVFEEEEIVKEEESDNGELTEEQEEEVDLIRETAYGVYQDLLEDSQIDVIAQKYNTSVQSTGFFSMENPNLSLGWPLALLNNIFQMDMGEISQPYETAHGMVVVQIKQKRDAYIPNYEQAQEDVKKAVLNSRALSVAKEKAGEFHITIKQQYDSSPLKDFPGIIKDMGLELYQTPAFTRGQYLPNIGIAREFQQAAFRLTKNNAISLVIETAKGYAILHLDEYIPIDIDKYEEERSSFAAKIENEYRSELFNDYLSRLRAEAKLENKVAKQK